MAGARACFLRLLNNLISSAPDMSDELGALDASAARVTSECASAVLCGGPI
jgi:hypothetical protein